MERLGLQSVGYMGTSPDGNCLFNAVAQGCSGLSAAFIKQHPSSGQERHTQMRMAAAARLQIDKQLQQLAQADQQLQISGNPHVTAKHKRSPSVPVASSLGADIQQDMAWIGGFCIKALALALNVAIVHLDGSRMQVYTKTHDHGGRMWDTQPAIKYFKAHTRRIVGKKKRQLKSSCLHALSSIMAGITSGQHCGQVHRSQRPICKLHLAMIASTTLPKSVLHWCRVASGYKLWCIHWYGVLSMSKLLCRLCTNCIIFLSKKEFL